MRTADRKNNLKNTVYFRQTSLDEGFEYTKSPQI